MPGKGALTVNEFVRSPRRDDATDRTKREVGEVGSGSQRTVGGWPSRACEGVEGVSGSLHERETKTKQIESDMNIGLSR